MWKAPVIELTMDERKELQRRVASHTTAVRDTNRAKIILLAADGIPSAQISKAVAMHESNVAKWRKRLREYRLDGRSTSWPS